MAEQWRPTRRQILIGGGVLAASAVTSVVLAGCTPSTTSGKPSGAAAEGGTLVVWTFFDQVKAAADKFMAANPKIKLDVKVFPGNEYQTKLRLALQQPSQAPDIFDLDMGYLGQFINTPVVADLTDLGGEDLLKGYVPYAAGFARSADGKVRGVVDHTSPGGFWYRRDVLEKYLGLKDLDAVNETMSNWPSIIEAGQKMAKDSGGAAKLLSSFDDVVRVEATRLKNFVKDGTFSIDPEWGTVLDIAREVRAKDVDAKLGAFSPAWGTAWNDGSVGMFAWPSWAFFMVDLAKSGNNWGIAKAPRPWFNGGRYVHIFEGSKKKELAMKYLQFLATPEWQKENMEKTFNMPALQSVYADNASSFVPEAFGGQKVLETFSEISEGIASQSADEYQGAIQTLWDGTIADMITNGTDNDAAFKALTAKVKSAYPDLKV